MGTAVSTKPPSRQTWAGGGVGFRLRDQLFRDPTRALRRKKGVGQGWRRGALRAEQSQGTGAEPLLLGVAVGGP